MTQTEKVLEAGTINPSSWTAPITTTRLIAGFGAGFLSVLIFSHGLLWILQTAGVAVPLPAWSMMPVPPFGVPQTFSGAFFGGLWGVAYAMIEPRLTARFGWWAGGIVFGGILPLVVLWFIVFPLKGIPVGGGFALVGAIRDFALHAIFGLGVAIFFRAGLRAGGRRVAS